MSIDEYYLEKDGLWQTDGEKAGLVMTKQEIVDAATAAMGDAAQELRPTEIAYLELLKLPLTNEWRALNQTVYACLRDEIAADWQWDAEKVQNHFESIAYHPDMETVKRSMRVNAADDRYNNRSKIGNDCTCQPENRDAFEEWASTKSWYSRSRKPNGDYWDKEAQCAWETWQYLASKHETGAARTGQPVGVTMQDLYELSDHRANCVNGASLRSFWFWWRRQNNMEYREAERAILGYFERYVNTEEDETTRELTPSDIDSYFNGLTRGKQGNNKPIGYCQDYIPAMFETGGGEFRVVTACGGAYNTPLYLSPQKRESGEQYAWVIEHRDSESRSPKYFSGYITGTSGWSTDHNLAVRFARRRDAEIMRDTMFSGMCHRLAEHGWATNEIEGDK